MDFNEVKSVPFGGYSKSDVERYVREQNDKFNSFIENTNSQIVYYTNSVAELEKAIKLLHLQKSDLEDEVAKLRFTIENEYKRIEKLTAENNKYMSYTQDIEDYGISKSSDTYDAQRRAKFILAKAHDESDRILAEVKRKAAIVFRKLKSSEEQATTRANEIAHKLLEEANLQASGIVSRAQERARDIIETANQTLQRMSLEKSRLEADIMKADTHVSNTGANSSTIGNPNASNGQVRSNPSSSDIGIEDSVNAQDDNTIDLNSDNSPTDDQLSFSNKSEGITIEMDVIRKDIDDSLLDLVETLDGITTSL